MAISKVTAGKLAAQADREWQRKLDALGLKRWSPEAKGAPGTVLRNLYEAKIFADEMQHEANT